jgi:hypothetical protein
LFAAALTFRGYLVLCFLAYFAGGHEMVSFLSCVPLKAAGFTPLIAGGGVHGFVEQQLTPQLGLGNLGLRDLPEAQSGPVRRWRAITMGRFR